MNIKQTPLYLTAIVLILTANSSTGQLRNEFAGRGTVDPGPGHVIDLEISLYRDLDDLDYPRGDYEGNTQSVLLSEQDRYEVIIQNFADAIFEITCEYLGRAQTLAPLDRDIDLVDGNDHGFQHVHTIPDRPSRTSGPRSGIGAVPSHAAMSLIIIAPIPISSPAANPRA